MRMKNLLTIAVVLIFQSGCVGNPWQQFQINIQGYVGYDFNFVTQLLHLNNDRRLSKPEGYPLPNGDVQHEFIWDKRGAQTCIVLFEVNPETKKIVSVGSKGGTYACQWNG